MDSSNTPGSISVALCTYNGQAHLAEQLASIDKQTRTPMEIVICDDLSTDSTKSLIESFAQQSAVSVRFHRNVEQLGSTRNFNQAVRLCRGEYVALCDQDDRWHPEKLAVLASLLDRNRDAGMAFSDANLIDSRSQPTGGTAWESFRFPERVQNLFLKDPVRILLERPVVTGATMIFRRSLLEYFDSIPSTWIHDGWIAWMCALWSRPVLVREKLTDYRVHAAQQLGVGGNSGAERTAQTLREQRKRYAQQAASLADLLAYSQRFPELRHHLAALNEAIAFAKQRANAPQSYAGRALFLLRHVEDYAKLSGSTWRSLLRDLLMHDAEPT
jgi:glycosyltransferase involved in cell wall biosynthesis